MSITYPEAQPGRTAKAATAPAARDGSALFPGGAANLYDRARASRARGGKGLSAAWIAGPMAVVLVGGAIALSVPHHAAAPTASSHTTVSTTTSTAPAPLVAAGKPAPAKAEVAAPAPAASKTVAHTVASRNAAASTPAHRTASAASRTIARSTTSDALPAGPQPYAATQDGQPAQAQAAPVAAAAPQAATTRSTATPGNFAFTAPATGPNGAAPAKAAPNSPVAVTPNTPAASQTAPGGTSGATSPQS